MTDRKNPQSSSTRTVAVIAVIVLIVIAIAGIVLANRQKSEADAIETVAADTTPLSASAPTGASAASGAASAGVPSDPNGLVFAVKSAKLPADANDKLGSLADAVRKDNKTLVIVVRYAANGDPVGELELAKNRAEAIRHALQANGVSLSSIRTEIAELPPTLLAASEANRVQVTLR